MTRRSRRSTTRAAALVAAALGAATVMAGLVEPSAAAADRPQVGWSDHDVVTGAQVRAVVKRSSRPAGARLVLERKYLDGWRVADRSAEETAKGYVLDVPTDQLGSFPYRVAARDGGKTVATSAKETITVRPPYDPPGRGQQHVFSSAPRVRWDSCSTITWTFNPTNAPSHGLGQVKEGVRRIHLATGLDFRYAGKTDNKPDPYGNHAGNADVIIGWRTAQDYGPFDKKPKTVGVGGNLYYSGYQEADGTKVNKAVQGGVVLNASRTSQLSNGFGKGTTWGEVVIHELGHVMGLAHTDAESQIMYPSVTRRNANWGAGDLAGFRMLGDVRGCLTGPSARGTGTPGTSVWR